MISACFDDSKSLKVVGMWSKVTDGGRKAAIKVEETNFGVRNDD